MLLLIIAVSPVEKNILAHRCPGTYNEATTQTHERVKENHEKIPPGA